MKEWEGVLVAILFIFFITFSYFGLIHKQQLDAETERIVAFYDILFNCNITDYNGTDHIKNMVIV